MSLLLISQAYAASDASFDDDFEPTALECSTVLCNSNKDKNLPSSTQDEIKTTSASQNVPVQNSKTVKNIFKAKAKSVRYSDGDHKRVKTKSKRRKGICKIIRSKISLTLPVIQPSNSKASEKNEVASQMNCLKNGNEIEKSSDLNSKDDSTTVFGNGFLHRPTFSDLVNCTETPPQNKFPCNERSKVCKDLTGLQNHQNTHKRVGIRESFPCVKCDCYFRSQNELEVHEKLVHNEGVVKSTEVISSLNETSVRQRRSTAAVTINVDNKDDCEKSSVETSSNRKVSNEAEKLGHPNLKIAIVRVKRCDDLVQLYLNKEVTNSKKIVQRETTTSSTVKPVECPDKKPFQCVTCTKSFARKKYLQKHQRTHTVEKRFKFITCDKSFKLKQNFLVHQRTHTGKKPFKCVTCVKVFAEKKTLVNHQRTHTGEKPFKCMTCDKSFAVQSTLRVHHRTHTGEKPFKCVTCAKVFAEKKALVNHQRTHTGEKPFKCVTCAKSFAEKRTMKRHQRTHTGEKPFKCGTCTDSFARKDTLLIHLRKHN